MNETKDPHFKALGDKSAAARRSDPAAMKRWKDAIAAGRRKAWAKYRALLAKEQETLEKE